MELSIIIITYNQIKYICQCLDSLANIISRVDVEVIVVDNGSSDGTCQFLRENYPLVTIIENNSNYGVAYARNRGFEVACGRKLLILDNDTISNEEAIDGMLDYMDNHIHVGICACCLTDLNGCVQQSFKPYPGLYEKLSNVINRRRGMMVSLPENPIEPVYVIGACQIIRREVVEQIGLLDEHMFFGPEDADYCLRAASVGWKIVYLPKYSLVHFWQRTSGKQLFSRLAWLHLKALVYFYRKHHRWWR